MRAWVRSSWLPAVLGTALLFAVVIQIPQFLYTRDARYQGIAVHLNSDEHVYLARVQEGLSGRLEQSAEAIIGDPKLRGSQPALLEGIVGTVFAPTGWRAATVLQVMDSITIFFVFLSLFFFLRLCGFSVRQSYVGTALFCIIELYNLNRPIHQGLSFVLLLSALNFFILGREKRWVWGILGALFLGLLFGDYFWSWSFGWLWVAIVFFGDVLERRKQLMRRTGLMIGVAMFAAAPFLFELFSITQHPLFTDARFRSGISLSRLPESVPYSVLFLIMTAGVLGALWLKPKKMRPHRYAVIFLFTAFIAIHQQALHGMVFNFVSHYLFPMAAAAIGVVLMAWTVRSWPLMIAAAMAAIYLGAVGWDGRFVLTQFSVIDRFDEQHLASSLPVLDALPRSTILSDPQTEMFIAGSTKHDVVYSLYLKNILMSHESIAERYCATQLPVRPDDRHFAREMLIWPDANGAFQDNGLRIREVALVEEACTELDRAPADALRRFGVQYILWDEKRRPAWNLHRLHVQLKKMGSGSGWSLWEVRNER